MENSTVKIQSRVKVNLVSVTTHVSPVTERSEYLSPDVLQAALVSLQDWVLSQDQGKVRAEQTNRTNRVLVDKENPSSILPPVDIGAV